MYWKVKQFCRQTNCYFSYEINYKSLLLNRKGNKEKQAENDKQDD
jgi:hypothetical protein